MSVWAACAQGNRRRAEDSSFAERFERLERELDGRLGVFGADAARGERLGYRAGERFPVCSTFKFLLAAAVLKRSERDATLLARRIDYRNRALISHSPVTERHAAQGMTVAGLCAAALQYSDNTAANLLMELLGGPVAVTAFARSIGDGEFRLDRWETELNTAIPDDPRDTSTPSAMGFCLDRLLLGDALEPGRRAQLRDWMLANTTGAARIRAGIPGGWKIADKTGSGDYGTANDIAVLWPTHRPPLVVAIYTGRRETAAKPRDEVVAAAARIVVDWWSDARTFRG